MAVAAGFASDAVPLTVGAVSLVPLLVAVAAADEEEDFDGATPEFRAEVGADVESVVLSDVDSCGLAEVAVAAGAAFVPDVVLEPWCLR